MARWFFPMVRTSTAHLLRRWMIEMSHDSRARWVPLGLWHNQLEGAVGGREAGHFDVDEAGVAGRLPDVVLVEFLAPLGPHGPQGAGRTDPVDQRREAGEIGGLVEAPDHDVGRAGPLDLDASPGQLGLEGAIAIQKVI